MPTDQSKQQLSYVFLCATPFLVFIIVAVRAPRVPGVYLLRNDVDRHLSDNVAATKNADFSTGVSSDWSGNSDGFFFC